MNSEQPPERDDEIEEPLNMSPGSRKESYAASSDRLEARNGEQFEYPHWQQTAEVFEIKMGPDLWAPNIGE